MRQILFTVLAVYVLPAASVARADDFVPTILKFFPARWEVTGADGTLLFTVDWKLVSGGKAIAGPSRSPSGEESFAMAGWDLEQKKWVHTWFAPDGGSGWIDVVKFENNTFSGPVRLVDKDGKSVSGVCYNKIIDKDHFEITYLIGAEKLVFHARRIKK